MSSSDFSAPLQSATDGAMDRKNSQRYRAGRPQRPPQDRPGPPPKVYYLKLALSRANDEIYKLTMQLRHLQALKRQSEDPSVDVPHMDCQMKVTQFSTPRPQCDPQDHSGPPPKVSHLKLALTRANDEICKLTTQLRDLEEFNVESPQSHQTSEAAVEGPSVDVPHVDSQVKETQLNSRRPKCPPHDRPGPPPKVYHLKLALTRANDEIYNLTTKLRDLEEFKRETLENFQTSKATVDSPSVDDLHVDCQMKETQLSSQNVELVQDNEAWQVKFTALEDEYNKNLAKMLNWQKLQIEHKKKVDVFEDQINQRDTELVDLRQQKEDLSQMLTETQNQLSSTNLELLQSNEDWQAKYSALEKSFADQLHLKEKSLDMLHVDHQMNMNQLETKIQQQDEEILHLIKEKDHLSEQLAESQSQLLSKRADVCQNNEAWQKQYDALEQKTTQYLALKDKSSEVLKVDYQINLDQLEKKIHHLSEQLAESQSQLLSERADVRQNNEAWQKKCDALEKNTKDMDLKDKSSESKINALLLDRKALDEKLKEELAKTQQLELEKKVLVQLHQSQETEVQQMKDESKILEDVCLQMKRKSRSVFGKKMEDRVTEVENMKRKMQAKELKKKERQENMEKQEENTPMGFFNWIRIKRSA